MTVVFVVMPYAKATSSYKRRAVAYKRRYTTAARTRRSAPAALYPPARTPALALKCVDVLTTGAVQSTTAPAVLAVPLLGSGFFNRLSNRTRGLSLQLTGFISPTGTNTGGQNSQYMRILIYYDRQANAASPSQATLLTDTTSAGTAVAVTPESGINMNQRDRFMVLRDRKVLLPSIGANGIASVDPSGVQCLNDLGKGGMAYQEFIKLKGLETCYNSTNGGTVADIATGAFGILVFNTDSSGSPAWNFTLQTRFKFLD